MRPPLETTKSIIAMDGLLKALGAEIVPKYSITIPVRGAVIIDSSSEVTDSQADTRALKQLSNQPTESYVVDMSGRSRFPRSHTPLKHEVGYRHLGGLNSRLTSERESLTGRHCRLRSVEYRFYSLAVDDNVHSCLLVHQT